MEKNHVKKLGRILKEEGFEVEGSTFVTIMEDELCRLREEKSEVDIPF